MSYKHDHGIRKTASGSPRDKHYSTRTRASHLYNRGPYHQPGTGMGYYKSPWKRFTDKVKVFFDGITGKFRKNVKGPSVETVEKEHFDKLVMPKSSKTIRSTTRAHQRKGLK